MALEIPNFPNPYDVNTPLAEAYGWISGISLDRSSNGGRVVLNVNPNAAAWTSPPIAQIGVTLGETMVPPVAADPSADPPVAAQDAVTFPSFGELMSDPDFANAFSVIGTTLYTHLKFHPKLAGATDSLQVKKKEQEKPTKKEAEKKKTVKE